MRQKLTMLAILLITPVYLSGCVALLAAGAGAGTVSYLEGVYSENVAVGMHTAYRACLASVPAAGYTLTSKQKSAQQSYVTAATKTTSGLTHSTTTIHITIDKLTKNSSKISIRFGTFGDRKQSMALMHKIKAKL